MWLEKALEPPSTVWSGSGRGNINVIINYKNDGIRPLSGRRCS